MEKISKATKKNWDKLNVNESEKKLEHRANKRMSVKKIIPKELFNNKNNVKIIKPYIDYINENYSKVNIEKIMRTFCIRWLIENELLNENFEYEKNNIKIFLKENNDIFLDVFKFKLPKDEDDILGIIYQCLQNEGDKVFTCKKGEGFAQGIFQKILTCGDVVEEERVGGIGSTNKEG